MLPISDIYACCRAIPRLYPQMETEWQTNQEGPPDRTLLFQLMLLHFVCSSSRCRLLLRFISRSLASNGIFTDSPFLPWVFFRRGSAKHKPHLMLVMGTVTREEQTVQVLQVERHKNSCTFANSIIRGTRYIASYSFAFHAYRHLLEGHRLARQIFLCSLCKEYHCVGPNVSFLFFPAASYCLMTTVIWIIPATWHSLSSLQDLLTATYWAVSRESWWNLVKSSWNERDVQCSTIWLKMGKGLQDLHLQHVSGHVLAFSQSHWGASSPALHNMEQSLEALESHDIKMEANCTVQGGGRVPCLVCSVQLHHQQSF